MTFLRVQVTGDEKVIAGLRSLRLKSKDLSGAWQRIGAAIRKDAIPMTPVLSGRLVRSIRAGKSKSQATVRVGGRGLVYAPIQHYGGYNNIQGKPFLTSALAANENKARQEVSREIDRIIRESGLK